MTLPKALQEMDKFVRLKTTQRPLFADVILNSMPRWIPVSERLPEKTGKYLVTVKNGNVYAGTYSAYEGKFNNSVIAWMELPEPYEEAADETD